MAFPSRTRSIRNSFFFTAFLTLSLPVSAAPSECGAGYRHVKHSRHGDAITALKTCIELASKIPGADRKETSKTLAWANYLLAYAFYHVADMDQAFVHAEDARALSQSITPKFTPKQLKLLDKIAAISKLRLSSSRALEFSLLMSANDCSESMNLDTGSPDIVTRFQRCKNAQDSQKNVPSWLPNRSADSDPECPALLELYERCTIVYCAGGGYGDVKPMLELGRRKFDCPDQLSIPQAEPLLGGDPFTDTATSTQPAP
jgi:hypothetical protein